MADRQLKGIDGWLLVFMALLVLTAAAHMVIFGIGQQKTALFSERYGSLPWSIAIGGWIYHGARTLIPLIVFWRMLRVRRWSSIVFAVAGLWLLFAGVELIDFAWAALTMPGAFQGLLPMLIRTLLGKGFLALAGTFYLLASIRVANTYPRADSSEALAETFE